MVHHQETVRDGVEERPRVWRGDDWAQVCDGGRGGRGGGVQARRAGGVRHAGDTGSAIECRPVRPVGQRRGGVQGWRPVRVGRGRRSDSCLENQRRTRSAAHAAVHVTGARVRQLPRGGEQRQVRPRGYGSGAEAGAVGT